MYACHVCCFVVRTVDLREYVVCSGAFASSLLGRCATFRKWEYSGLGRLLDGHSLGIMQPEMANLPAVEVGLNNALLLVYSALEAMT